MNVHIPGATCLLASISPPYFIDWIRCVWYRRGSRELDHQSLAGAGQGVIVFLHGHEVSTNLAGTVAPRFTALE